VSGVDTSTSACLFACFCFWYDKILWTRSGGTSATHNHPSIPEATVFFFARNIFCVIAKSLIRRIEHVLFVHVHLVLPMNTHSSTCHPVSCSAICLLFSFIVHVVGSSSPTCRCEQTNTQTNKCTLTHLRSIYFWHQPTCQPPLSQRTHIRFFFTHT
jgi:hypothetical protein